MSLPLWIVLVEDDPKQAEHSADEIKSWGLHDQVEIVPTEMEFRARLEAGKWGDPDCRPHAFILDVMVQWTTPKPGMQPPPPEVIDGGYFRAGVRCARLLLDQLQGEPRPSIALLTVLDRGGLDIAQGVRYFSKGDSNHLKRWLERIASGMSDQPRT